MNHFITLEKAKDMTTLYRNERENLLKDMYQGQNILPICESFDRAAFDRLLSETNCAGVRIYYGLDDAMRLHAVVVGYDENDADILPGNTSALSTNEDDFEGVVEEGSRCPDMCPPTSDLNS